MGAAAEVSVWKHAAIVRRERGFEIKDLGQHAGTFMNGQSVDESGFAHRWELAARSANFRKLARSHSRVVQIAEETTSNRRSTAAIDVLNQSDRHFRSESPKPNSACG